MQASRIPVKPTKPQKIKLVNLLKTKQSTNTLYKNFHAKTRKQKNTMKTTKNTSNKQGKQQNPLKNTEKTFKNSSLNLCLKNTRTKQKFHFYNELIQKFYESFGSNVN